MDPALSSIQNKLQSMFNYTSYPFERLSSFVPVLLNLCQLLPFIYFIIYIEYIYSIYGPFFFLHRD